MHNKQTRYLWYDYDRLHIDFRACRRVELCLLGIQIWDIYSTVLCAILNPKSLMVAHFHQVNPTQLNRFYFGWYHPKRNKSKNPKTKTKK